MRARRRRRIVGLARRRAGRLELLRRLVAGIREAVGDQLRRDLAVDVEPLALQVRAERAALGGRLVEVEPEPVERLPGSARSRRPPRGTGRCPRCAAPRRRRGGGRTASCRGRCERLRRGGTRSARGRSGPGHPSTPYRTRPMLYGAHVSVAGGITNAIPRAVDLGCDAIQIFTQSSRQWKPTNHDPAMLAQFGPMAAEAGHPLRHLPRDLLHQPRVAGRRDLPEVGRRAHEHRRASRRRSAPTSASTSARTAATGWRPRCRASRPDSTPRSRCSPPTPGCCSRTPPAPATRSAATSASSPR